MFKKRDDYIYENVHTKKQIKTYLSFALIFVLLISLIAVLFVFVLRKEEAAVFEKFIQAVQAEDYDQAMEFYYSVQERATDLKYESKDRASYKDQQIAMEDLIGVEVDLMLDKIITGQDLEDFEQKKLNDLKFLSSMHVIPFIKQSTEKLLDGELEPEIWQARLNNFIDIDYLKDYSRDLLSQKESLFSKINDFKRAGELENGANWQLTWSSWDELANDSEGSRFAREYAGFRLLSYQEREYAHLMGLTEEMIIAQQYYTAYNLLSRMHEVFPERKELSERLIWAEGLIPASIVSWRGDVVVLSIRPLIVRPELAFGKSTESAYAYNALITNDEFLEILNQLYKEDYVLISPRQFDPWPERRVDLEVPAGKKPLILIFDRWQYSVLNQVAGTASRLYLDKNDQIMVQAGDVDGRDLDAIPILEDFLEAHPDFSFDGAKAVISLNTNESVFGYTVTSGQVVGSQEAWGRIGETYPEVTEEELRSHRDTVGRVFKYLLEQGWDFSSSGNAGFDTASLNHDELQEEIDSWSLVVNSWLPESKMFVFPNGSHVYGQEDLLDLMLSRGYNIFIGQGPKPYMFYDRKFVHLDSLAVNGNTLTALSGYLTTILDSHEVLDHNLR